MAPERVNLLILHQLGGELYQIEHKRHTISSWTTNLFLKNHIRKEVVALQDRFKDKDRDLAQQRKVLKAYEEERSFILRFLSALFALLNVREV